MAFSIPISSVWSVENHYSNREVDELDEQKVNFKSQPNKEKLIMDPPCSSYRDLYSITAKSVDLTRDLGSILRPSQDKILLGNRGQHQDLDACDGHNSSSSGSGGGPFSSFIRSPHRLAVRDLFGAQDTAFEPLRLHLKPASEGEEELPTDFIRQLGN